MGGGVQEAGPLPEVHAGGEGTWVAAGTGARSSFPAWFFTSSLSLMSCLSCLSLHLDLFMSLFEIMQRTKFLSGRRLHLPAKRPWVSTSSPPDSVFCSAKWA